MGSLIYLSQSQTGITMCSHKQARVTHTQTQTQISVSFSVCTVCLPIASSTAGTADKFPLLACQQYYFTHKAHTQNPLPNPQYTQTFLIHQHKFNTLLYNNEIIKIIDPLLCLPLFGSVFRSISSLDAC